MDQHQPYRNRGRKGKFLFVLFFPLLVLLLGFIVMKLWNAILPQIVPVRQLTYGQALGLFILCRLLFGGFGFRGRGGGQNFGNRAWQNRWQNMSEEEKANLKARWQQRCQERKREKE